MKKSIGIVYRVLVVVLSVFVLGGTAAVSAGEMSDNARTNPLVLSGNRYEALQQRLPAGFKILLRDKDGVVVRATDNQGILWTFVPNEREDSFQLVGFGFKDGNMVEKTAVVWYKNGWLGACEENIGKGWECYADVFFEHQSEAEPDAEFTKAYWTKKGIMPPKAARWLKEFKKKQKKETDMRNKCLKLQGEQGGEECLAKYPEIAEERYESACLKFPKAENCKEQLVLLLEKYPENTNYRNQLECFQAVERGENRDCALEYRRDYKYQY